MSENRLGQETSPYLLQHRDNPVHWLPWGAEAFALARAENRPILLSIGYAACHWCHVMAHESFEDPETAAVMNRLFVNIKVDREERPDLDQIYQAALSALGQSGGWPLTMFLSPEGEPFWGGTYFPPTNRYGRPAFRDVLVGVADAYATQQNDIRQNVEALGAALEKLSHNREGPVPPLTILNQVANRLVRQVDPFHGGLEGAPKFPQTPLFELLWRGWRRNGSTELRQAVVNTLTRMCQGGIYDHLGGGFARYSTDERWLAPHFEKMLYDNAQLLHLLTHVWQDTQQPLFAQRIDETVGWLLREMIADGGGFAATLDADSEGEEGRYYVWSGAVIDARLGPDASTFGRVYDVHSGGNWEGVNILNRLLSTDRSDNPAESALAPLRRKLFEAREGRERPGWDDKVLADWNGLMIAGLVEAAMAFDRPDWLAAAERAFAFVRDTMVVEGRLHHAWRQGVLKHLASIDDLAAMTRGALALYDATGTPGYLAAAQRWAADAQAFHWDQEQSGYFFTASDAATSAGTPLICRPKNASDHATPSGNGLMVGNLARLYLITGEDGYRAKAEATTRAFAGELSHNFFPLTTLLNGVETLQAGTQIVIVGMPGHADAMALERAVYSVSLPDRVLLRIAPGFDLPPHHPAHGKQAVGGVATAYVCRGQSCTPPVTTAADLTEILRRLPAQRRVNS